MSRGRLRPWNQALLQQLVMVSRGDAAADCFFAGGRILDVYNGRLIEANLATKGQRIAYLGEDRQMVGESTRIVDVSNKVLVPGYIEPHGHPFQLYNPATYADGILRRGTTCSVNDDLFLFILTTAPKLLEIVEIMAAHPVKMLWSARLDPQTTAQSAVDRFTTEAIYQLLEHPLFVQVGELTDWPSLLSGNALMQEWMVESARWGKRAEGHAPGASARTLGALAAAGVSCCHEAIRPEEVLSRLQTGMYAILRHSSLRLDLPQLLQGLLAAPAVAWERLMMTTDAPTPSYFNWGFTDYLIQVALEQGLEPIRAYQLVTRNPAVYHGLENEIGGLAPGRLADILVLPSLHHPTPEMIWADGELAVVRDGASIRSLFTGINPNWPKLGLPPLSREPLRIGTQALQPLYSGESRVPVLELVDPVITRSRWESIDGNRLQVREQRIEIDPDSGLCYGALIARDHSRIAHALIKGFASRLGGIASSYTIALDLLVLGQNPADMQKALFRMEELGGGIVLVENGQVLAELPLPVGGGMSLEDIDYVKQKTMEIEQALARAGYPHHDLIYSLLFLTSTHLPEIRLTGEGVLMVKDRRLLQPALLL